MRVLLLLLCVASCAAQPLKRMLVFTRTAPMGKVYRHANIPASVEALKKLGAENGFAVDATEDPAVFTDDSLKRYAVLVFDNSNGQAFDTEAQRAAFQHYIRRGGGFVGIHNASGTEREWEYFAKVLGARFVEHPVLQKFVVRVADATSPLVQGVPGEWTVEDECYFHTLYAPDLHVLLTADRTQLQGTDKMKTDAAGYPNPLPLAWWHQFDGGREFFIALGHKPEMYSDPVFVGLLKRGVLWAMER